MGYFMFNSTWNKQLFTQWIFKINAITSTLNWLWNSSKPLLHPQVNWSHLSCCSTPPLMLPCPSGRRWCLILYNSCLLTYKAVETKHFFAVTLKWIPTLIFNLMLHMRKSRPDESLSLEMSARFHSTLATFQQQQKIIYLSFKMNAIDDAFFSGTLPYSIYLNCLLIWRFLFRGVLNSIDPLHISASAELVMPTGLKTSIQGCLKFHWSSAHIRFCWTCNAWRFVGFYSGVS